MYLQARREPGDCWVMHSSFEGAVVIEEGDLREIDIPAYRSAHRRQGCLSLPKQSRSPGV
jgi:hypothetical protein